LLSLIEAQNIPYFPDLKALVFWEVPCKVHLHVMVSRCIQLQAPEISAFAGGIVVVQHDLSMEGGRRISIGACTSCSVACSENEFIEHKFVPLRECVVN
jgi:hypothetical protein